MITAQQKKFVQSLKQKKFRTQHNVFVVEGVKMLNELLQSDFEVEHIFGTSKWIEDNPNVNGVEISEKELSSISSLKTPNEVIAVVKQKSQQIDELANQFTIVLDTVQDPGNLGTIIRTADWFGVNNVICSNNSVDIYNPKVMQATMGSFFRVNVIYTNLIEFFNQNKSLVVYGALLDGENVYKKNLNSKGSVLLMGNESQGISKDLMPFITNKIKIPAVGKAESLNVATATAILCFECRRNHQIHSSQ